MDILEVLHFENEKPQTFDPTIAFKKFKIFCFEVSSLYLQYLQKTAKIYTKKSNLIVNFNKFQIIICPVKAFI